MINIRNRDENICFGFEIDNYQFTMDEVIDEYDKNWLNIKFVYSDSKGSYYEYKDPCIITSEWHELITEFEKVYNGLSEKCRSEFLEPYFEIYLEVIDDKIYELRCSFDDYIDINIENKALISKEELFNYIELLKKEYNKFPER